MKGFISTGIKELDRLLGGGFPSKTVILLSGDAGTGKTLFGLNFLMEGAKRRERVCYLSLNETPDELMRAAAGIEKLRGLRRYVGRNFVLIHVNLDELSRLDEFTELFERYPKVDRLVIDNVNKLLFFAESRKEYRMNMARLVRYLKKKVGCALLLCETIDDTIDTKNGEAYECDGVVHISFLDVEEKPKRVITAYKMRYAPIDPRVPYEFVINSKKIGLGRMKVI